MIAAALAAAALFCAGSPGEPRCETTGGAAIAIQADELATLNELAGAAFLSQRYVRESGIADEWRVVGPGQGGDCEDRLLWAAQELRARHPHMADAYRFVLLHEDYGDGAGAQRVRRMHMVLVVGEYVIDTQFRRLRHVSDYATRRAYAPEAAMSGRWVRTALE